MILNPLQAFVLHENIPWARFQPLKPVKRDESSIFTVILVRFLAQGMFFMQNKCLQWIRNHQEPLV